MTSKHKKLNLKHLSYYGYIQEDKPDFKVPGPVPEDFTFNTPIGIVQDRHHNLWVCDTGNNRIVIFDKDLETIHHIMTQPGTGKTEAEKTPFLMPFHVCPHPEKNLMFLTDMGNTRIVVFSYDKTNVNYAYSFGYKGDGINSESLDPLEDPNGITLVEEAEGKFFVYVCDEFFHTENDSRNRCVKFTEQGEFVEQFKTIVDPTTGKEHDLI
jgi:sugar lactone lactonase YvrE